MFQWTQGFLLVWAGCIVFSRRSKARRAKPVLHMGGDLGLPSLFQDLIPNGSICQHLCFVAQILRFFKQPLFQRF
ncbi:hypothetical protein A4A58_13185 [Tardiphaga robiniae]|uniref:Uncharacterized protein n=1 Tax=Tardiphaga robiniae TaxID=943830 RepID=A0A163XTA5_9BRAD|nr:hypothetical protein A4A58_13185 [Tardiphaga robiniae]